LCSKSVKILEECSDLIKKVGVVHRFSMVEDITKLWETFSLTEEESMTVAVREENLEEFASKGNDCLEGNDCLVGKLIAERVVGKDTIRSKMVRWWKPTGSVSFKVLGENLFLVEFEYFWEKFRVMEGRPWDFDGSLFSLANFDGLIPPTQMNFDTVGLWVRMYNLPLACMGRETGRSLGETIGHVEEVETDDDGCG
jgi:hypothetical protein